MGQQMHQRKLEAFRNQGGLCWLCDEPLDLFQPAHTYGCSTWEHVIPRCCGGSNSRANLTLTHYECNMGRGERIIWRLKRPKIVQRPVKLDPYKLQQHFERQLVPKLIKLLRACEAQRL